MPQTFYAIEHIPTGGTLPQRRAEDFGSNMSRFRACDVEPSRELPPALFAEKRHAAIALTYWLRGIVTRAAPGMARPDGANPDTVSIGGEPHWVQPRADRHAENMRVIEVVVVVRTMGAAVKPRLIQPHPAQAVPARH